MKTTPTLVFVDIDGTLVSPPTVWDFLHFCMQHKIVSRFSLLRAGLEALRNRFNFFNHTKAVKYWLGLLTGISTEKLNYYCRQTFEQRIRFHFIPTILAKIAQHKHQGDQIILISSTLQPFAEIIAELLQLDSYYGLEIITIDNKITNQTVVPAPYHLGKVYYAQQHAQKHNKALKDAFFYTDSISDLPLLEAVGFPVTINPDPYLYKIARSKNWLILRDKQRVDVVTYWAELVKMKRS